MLVVSACRWLFAKDISFFIRSIARCSGRLDDNKSVSGTMHKREKKPKLIKNSAHFLFLQLVFFNFLKRISIEKALYFRYIHPPKPPLIRSLKPKKPFKKLY